MREKDEKFGFSEKDRKRIWKNHMEEIMNKENDWEHVTAASMVEGSTKKITREEMAILYLLPLLLYHRPLLLAILLRLLPPLPFLTLSGFFNEMLEVFEPGALNYSTFSRPILSTLSVSRNPILTFLPLSESLDYLLCVLIPLTPGPAFCPLMSRTLALLPIFSGRAYPLLNLLPPFFLRSIPTLIM